MSPPHEARRRRQPFTRRSMNGDDDSRRAITNLGNRVTSFGEVGHGAPPRHATTTNQRRWPMSAKLQSLSLSCLNQDPKFLLPWPSCQQLPVGYRSVKKRRDARMPHATLRRESPQTAIGLRCQPARHHEGQSLEQTPARNRSTCALWRTSGELVGLLSSA